MDPLPVTRPARSGQVLPLPAGGVPVEQLVARTLGGDRSAEGLLYRRYAPGVLAMAGRLLQSTTSAEDVVHDAFIIAFGRLRQLADPAQFRGWLVTIVVSLVRRRLRRERLLRFVGLDGEPESTLERFARPGTTVEARGELALLGDTLRALPADLRLAWGLRYVEGEKLEDVAAHLNKSLSTTKRYLAEAEARITARVSVAPPDGVS
ncbi:MAG: RNA polymerase sigma factor [Myxococcaceae bacterium]|jgi:RNA polymerase sigma factor (sigma-70 family)|nr:RNA polymerase sigma factor [Myxococcaceae bacterium]MCA3015125.1 RNA polymerase sigma factor [Myxococcaceae bacterium]